MTQYHNVMFTSISSPVWHMVSNYVKPTKCVTEFKPGIGALICHILFAIDGTTSQCLKLFIVNRIVDKADVCLVGTNCNAV